MDIRDKLATTIEWQAEWREQKAAEWPEDYRNQASARALRELAAHVRSLPVEDPRLVGFDAFADDERVMLGEEAGRWLSRVGFDGRPVDPDASLGQLAEISQDEEVREFSFELDRDDDEDAGEEAR